MPEPLHPPYSPSNLQPRLLNRWLDVNSQNGPLGRTQTYIVIPAFPKIVITFGAIANIVGVINYSSDHYCSLYNIPDTLDDLNFLICVAWLDKVGGTVYRYALNTPTPPSNVGFLGHTIGYDIPLYKNQKVGKNFRIEIWSIYGQNPVMYDNTPPIMTSVLGTVDYRWGLDSVLGDKSAVITGIPIQAVAGSFLLPLRNPAASVFIPQNAIVQDTEALDPELVSSYITDIPVIDLNDGIKKFIHIVDSAITISNDPLLNNYIGVLPFIDALTGLQKYMRVIDSQLVISDN